MPATLSTLAPMGRTNRFLLIREDVLDGTSGSLTDHLHGGSTIAISPSLSAVGLRLLENRGHPEDLCRSQREVLGHSFDTMGESLGVACGTEGLKLRSLCGSEHFPDKSAALAMKSPKRSTACVGSLRATKGTHLLTVALADGANLRLLIVAQIELSHQMVAAVAMVATSGVSAFGTFGTIATAAGAASGASIWTFRGLDGVGALSETHFRYDKSAKGQ
jgi:hypothetical protein